MSFTLEVKELIWLLGPPVDDIVEDDDEVDDADLFALMVIDEVEAVDELHCPISPLASVSNANTLALKSFNC